MDYDIHRMDNLEFSNGAVEDVYVQRLSGDNDTYLHTHYGRNTRGRMERITEADLEPATPNRSRTLTYGGIDGIYPEFVNDGTINGIAHRAGTYAPGAGCAR